MDCNQLTRTLIKLHSFDIAMEGFFGAGDVEQALTVRREIIELFETVPAVKWGELESLDEFFIDYNRILTDTDDSIFNRGYCCYSPDKKTFVYFQREEQDPDRLLHNNSITLVDSEKLATLKVFLPLDSRGNLAKINDYSFSPDGKFLSLKIKYFASSECQVINLNIETGEWSDFEIELDLNENTKIDYMDDGRLLVYTYGKMYQPPGPRITLAAVDQEGEIEILPVTSFKRSVLQTFEMLVYGDTIVRNLGGRPTEYHFVNLYTGEGLNIKGESLVKTNRGFYFLSSRGDKILYFNNQSNQKELIYQIPIAEGWENFDRLLFQKIAVLPDEDVLVGYSQNSNELTVIEISTKRIMSKIKVGTDHLTSDNRIQYLDVTPKGIVRVGLFGGHTRDYGGKVDDEL